MQAFDAKLAKVRDHRDKLQAQFEYEEGESAWVVWSVCVFEWRG